MAAKKLTKSKAQQIIEEAFLRNGYIRSRDDVRIKREGNGVYRNGFELRLVPKTKEELKLIQKAIVALELNLCTTYQFSGQLVQPIYGIDSPLITSPLGTRLFAFRNSYNYFCLRP